MTTLMTVLVGTASTSSCRSDATFAYERRVPATIALPEVRRLAVVAFVGSGGAALATALRDRIASEAAFLGPPSNAGLDAAVSPEDDAALAALARRCGADAVLAGRVSTLEVSRTLEAPTLLTKSAPGGPRDFATTRRLKTGRLQAVFRVVLASGRTRLGRAITADLRAERIEDPRPDLRTIAPRDVAQDAIPDDEQVMARLVDLAAAAIARDVTPRREPATVVWRDAGGLDGDARREFARREHALAAEKLRALLGESSAAEAAALSPGERAALLYDLALCEDAMGDLPRAERHLDESLSLENSELTQQALRDLRRRRGEGPR